VRIRAVRMRKRRLPMRPGDHAALRRRLLRRESPIVAVGAVLLFALAVFLVSRRSAWRLAVHAARTERAADSARRAPLLGRAAGAPLRFRAGWRSGSHSALRSGERVSVTARLRSPRRRRTQSRARAAAGPGRWRYSLLAAAGGD
jgi:hypothetical protein